MKNIEEFCLELKNDILKDIGEDKNWDTADYTMRFYGNSGEGGLTILKKNNQEVKRISQNNFTYFWNAINLLIDRAKTNKGTLTIYPNGEYESSFIWDEVAYLGYLKTNANNWFIYVYEKACERIQDRCNDLSIDCPALVEMTVVFDALGISKPALFYSENNPAMTFKLHLEQIYFYLEQPYESVFAEYDMIRKQVDGDVITDNQKQYKTTNEGELKGVFPRWNKLTFTLEPDSPYISYEEVREKLKFEWIEENA